MESIFGRNNAEGRKINAAERQIAADYLADVVELGTINLSEEYEKSEVDTAIIGKVDALLEGEQRALGIEPIHIEPQKIHLVSHNEFIRLRGYGASAFVEPISGHIYVDNSVKRGIIHESDAYEVKLLQHEAIHAISHLKYFFHSASNEIQTYRVGYSVTSAGSDIHSHFSGLNEAVTEELNRELFTKNIDQIKALLGSSEEDLQSVQFSYEPDRAVLSFLVDRITEAKNEKREVVWSRFKKGMLTGEMMHLRDIEEVFGQGALRMVAAMRSGTVLDLGENPEHQAMYQQKVISDYILKYLQTPDDEEKDDIAKRVLQPREYEALKKRIG